MISKKTKRLFLAINLPSNLKKEISNLIETLQTKNRGVKWVNPAGVHFTLHFLGEIEGKKEEEIKKIMVAVAKQFPRAQIQIGSIDAFPDLSQPRVIFLTAQQIGSRSLLALQKAVGRELERLGISLDQRPWRLHLTLGRVKGRLNFTSAPIAKQIRKPFTVASFELMSSVLKPTGAEYKTEASFRFKEQNNYLKIKS